MLQVPTGFLDALARSHTLVTRATVLTRSRRPVGEYRIVGGTVRVSASAKVRRQVEMTLEARPPRNAAHPLAPFGNLIRVERGVVLDGVPVLVPLGLFRIDDADEDQGLTRVAGSDLSVIFSEEATEWSLGTETNQKVGQVVDRLLELRGIPVNVAMLYNFSLPPSVIPDNSDRWEKSLELAKACGVDLRLTPEGIVEARDAIGLDTGAPVWTVSDGPGGVLVEATPRMSRSTGTYNRLILSQEGALSNGWFIRADVKDDNPASPTFYDGNFGRVSRRQSSDLLWDQAQAERAARAILASQLGRVATIDLQSLPNPALEEGDVIRVRRTDLGLDETHVVVDLEIGLGAGDTMRIGTLARSVGVV